MDVDQLIDDASVMGQIAGKLELNANHWGVSIEFVKIQRVEAGRLTNVLERKKQVRRRRERGGGGRREEREGANDGDILQRDVFACILRCVQYGVWCSFSPQRAT
jgi:hypothetical protein